MKKRNVVIRCLVLLMMIAVFAGFASTAKCESTGEYVDDYGRHDRKLKPCWQVMIFSSHSKSVSKPRRASSN